MESKKQTYIAGCALAVSIISLIVTIVMAVNQYKENIEVVSDKIYITELNLENGTIGCEIDVIVANTSHTTTSLLKSEAYKSFSGFKSSEKLTVTTTPDMPLTLIQGGAEKMVLCCQYQLDDTEISGLKSGENISDILANQWISVRVYSAKGTCYSSSARFKNAILKW